VTLLLAPDRSAAALAADPGPRRTTLANGLTVLSEHVPRVRSIAFGAFVRAGSLHEPRERMGVSHLLEHMVFKGTPTRTGTATSFELETLGGSLDAYTKREYTSYPGARARRRPARRRRRHRRPRLPPAAPRRRPALERNVILEEIGMVEGHARTISSSSATTRCLWGATPYGYSILCTLRAPVGALTTDDLRALHAPAYHRRISLSPAAGAVDPRRVVEALTGPGGPTRPANPTPDAGVQSAAGIRRPTSTCRPRAHADPRGRRARRRRRTTTTDATRSRW
jgi:predicted Zn-dependent peptidase